MNGVAAATTVNGQICAIGGVCTITASAGTISVGVTTVALGTNTRVLFDNSGLLGEYSITGSRQCRDVGEPDVHWHDLGRQRLRL